MLLAAGAWHWQSGGGAFSKKAQAPFPLLTRTALTSAALTPSTAPSLAPKATLAAEARTYVDKKSLRLSNTEKPLKDLVRQDAAVLLRNAFLDTKAPLELEIPAQLQSVEAPAAYIVQSRGPIGDRFRDSLSGAGASIVAYIPNNAYLVEASQDAADRLAGAPGVEKVLPYEPYYKLEAALLKSAVKDQALAEGQLLSVTLFEGHREQGLDAIRSTGAEILHEGRSPFGPIVTIQPQPDGLAALAQIAAVQTIESCHDRVVLNDLARTRVAVSADTLMLTNYLGLTGSNVMVAINDSGIDATHPDLTGRVFALDDNLLIDGVGHGTHVAGIIGGSGSKSSTITNAPGSKTGANFRGMAPGSKMFILPVDVNAGPVISDAYLIEKAAKTNAFIDNNSWGYRRSYEYNSSSATYDAAVRDALPLVSGSRPLLFVFAAGNDGFGNSDGSGGEIDTILSPGNAKNVITVGALDQLRNITNEVYITNADSTVSTVSTNTPFVGSTDSEDEVSSYSSRGNVGVGVEGPTGRFKPDVVAPGSFLISARSKDCKMELHPRTTNTFVYPAINIAPEGWDMYLFTIPFGTVEAEIRIYPTADFTNSFPDLPIYAKQGDFPSKNDLAGRTRITFPGDQPLTPGDWYYAVGNDSTLFVDYIVTETIIQTNAAGNRYEVLKGLDDGLGPNYRFDSGTSMAAPVVSGMLALMQEFFEQKLPASLRLTNSPALMKALIINGARSVNGRYDLQVQKELNVQGWGLANLTNSIPEALKDGKMTNSSVQFVDQNPTNALATGESRAWSMSLAPESLSNPLRITLVWTDPPGNPNAAIKLVNDLDLIVTNRQTGQVYYGNDITSESDWNLPVESGKPGTNDVINNVENVFIPEALGITVCE
jgi:subtilisin family serine protease